MCGSMLSIFLLFVVATVSSQMVPMCATTTNPQCTVTFTAEGTSQTGPTSTVWGAIMTTYLDVVDCRYCQVDNVPFNPSQQGPFNTKITSPMMTVTAVGCIPETTAITRRGFRGYDEAATVKTSTTARGHISHAKRQNATNPISGSGLPPQAQFYLVQINTAIYVIDLINIGSNLNSTCQDLQKSVNDTQDASIAINITQAADFVCAARDANLTHIDPSLVQIFAAALYAVELASNFTGTTNTTALCGSIDMDILTLPIFGVDGQGVQSYVCNTTNATLNTTFNTVTSTTTTASAGTVTPVSWSNQTSFGTAPLTTGPIITGASTGIAGSSWPIANYTGTRTRSYTGPRTRSGSDHPQSTITGSAYNGVPGPTAGSQSGFGPGYGEPTGTDVSGWSYGSFAGFPTGSGAGYSQPSGTGISGWPYGNLTGFATGSGSGYAQPTGTGGADDPFGIQLSSYELPSSPRLPPNPSTLHHYPVVSPSTNSVVFYGYGYGYEG